MVSEIYVLEHRGKNAYVLSKKQSFIFISTISTSWLWGLRLIYCIVSFNEPKAVKHKEVSSHLIQCHALPEKRNHLHQGNNCLWIWTLKSPTNQLKYHCSCSKSKTHWEIIHLDIFSLDSNFKSEHLDIQTLITGKTRAEQVLTW